MPGRSKRASKARTVDARTASPPTKTRRSEERSSAWDPTRRSAVRRAKSGAEVSVARTRAAVSSQVPRVRTAGVTRWASTPQTTGRITKRTSPITCHGGTQPASTSSGAKQGAVAAAPGGERAVGEDGEARLAGGARGQLQDGRVLRLDIGWRGRCWRHIGRTGDRLYGDDFQAAVAGTSELLAYMGRGEDAARASARRTRQDDRGRQPRGDRERHGSGERYAGEAAHEIKTRGEAERDAIAGSHPLRRETRGDL